MQVTLEFKGKQYIVIDEFDYKLAPGEIPFMWEDGNFSCDCNKSIFINSQCDSNFPEMECGDEIKLISVKE